MRRRQFMTLLALPKFGWLQHAGEKYIEWVRALVALSGMTYILLSSSYGQESVQRVDARQDSARSTMPVGPAIRPRRATIG
jgi:hypothetical protein